MQTRILTPIDYPAADRLSRVFNSYLYQLRSLEQVAVPHLSMAAYATIVVDDDITGDQYMLEMGSLLLQLTALSNSLNELARCLVGAYLNLEEFVSEGSDFQKFAALKRVEDAQLNGYTDPLDVTPDGKEFCLRTEPEALAPFQLPALLRPYFVGSPGSTEKIGTSQAADFAYFTSLVTNELLFGLRDPDQPATPANLSTCPAAEAADWGLSFGEPGPDERFYRFDTSLSGPALATAFTNLLDQCQEGATLFHALADDDAAGYGRLLALLTNIVGGDEGGPAAQ